jgi:hypothetical protein
VASGPIITALPEISNILLAEFSAPSIDPDVYGDLGAGLYS